MSDLKRYIDSLPLDPAPRELLRLIINRHPVPVAFSTLQELSGYSRAYLEPRLNDIVDTGAITRYKAGYGVEAVYSLADPRLLQHLNVLREPAGPPKPALSHQADTLPA